MKQKIILIVVAFLLFSCNKGNTKQQQENEKQQASKTLENKAKDVSWSYKKGTNGPNNWKNLCADFATCGGKIQSPIDIVVNNVAKPDGAAKPVFKYDKSKVNVTNNGHTVVFNVDANNTLTVGTKEYQLLQFHYHALSEHTINGKHFPLEVHFVHKHSDKAYLVIGAMYVEGKENELLKKYLDKFPTKKGNYTSEESFDLFSLLPKNKNYYNYNGSLTTPPCLEFVNWYVLKEPIYASKSQLEQFAKILHGNFRPVQPLNGRTIKSIN